MTNGTCTLLYNLISQPEWAKDTKHLYTAGKLAVKLSEVAEKMPNNADDVKEWESVDCGFTLEDGEFQAATEAFKFFVQKGVMRPSRLTVELQELLKLTQ